METIERNTRVSFHGVVVSDKMDKTIIVLVETYKKHKKYGKRVKYAKKYVAHDELGLAQVGDRVTIRGCRPLSKTKRFVLVSVDKVSIENETVTVEEEIIELANEILENAPENVESVTVEEIVKEDGSEALLVEEVIVNEDGSTEVVIEEVAVKEEE